MLFSIMSNLKAHHFKLHVQEVDQHTGRKWLIYDAKHHKDIFMSVGNMGFHWNDLGIQCGAVTTRSIFSQFRAIDIS